MVNGMRWWPNPFSIQDSPFTIELPSVADSIADGRLAVLLHLHRNVNGAGIDLFVGLGLLDDLPIRPAVEIFFDDHRDRLCLVIAQLDLDLLLHGLEVAV